MRPATRRQEGHRARRSRRLQGDRSSRGGFAIRRDERRPIRRVRWPSDHGAIVDGIRAQHWFGRGADSGLRIEHVGEAWLIELAGCGSGFQRHALERSPDGSATCRAGRNPAVARSYRAQQATRAATPACRSPLLPRQDAERCREGVGLRPLVGVQAACPGARPASIRGRDGRSPSLPPQATGAEAETPDRLRADGWPCPKSTVGLTAAAPWRLPRSRWL